jgi:hypothetical protein
MDMRNKTTTDADRKRAARATERIAKLTKDVRDLKHINGTVRKEAYGAGSAETLADVFYALRDLGLPGAQWLSQRLLMSRAKRAPFGLDKDVTLLVHREVMAHLKKCGQHSYAKMYQRKFGNGVAL